METLLIILLIIVLLAGFTACTRLSAGRNDSTSDGVSGPVITPVETGLSEPQETGNESEGHKEAGSDAEPDPIDNTAANLPGTDSNSGPGSEAPNAVPSNAPESTPTPKPSATPKPGAAPKPVATPEPSAAPAPTPVVPSGIVNPYVPYTYDQMMEESQKLQGKYPDILAAESIGSSVEGRDILLIKLGSGEKKIVLCGTHHAREYISSAYLMKMAEEYARAYTENKKFGNYNVRDLLDNVTVYIVPMVNPDGVNLVNKGLNAVANADAVQAMAMVKSTYREWKANINGVDLNRQYPAHWEEKYDNVGRPASENYKGAAAATEPEVQAMMKLSEENDFILAASFHTKGNAIYWADRGTVNEIPGVEAMTKRLASLTRYQRMPVSEKPSVYGAGYENWFRLKFKRPAFCIELTPYNDTDVPHDDRNFDKLVWNNAKYIGLFLADEALKR